MSLESKDATCVGSLCERANSHGTRDFAGDTYLQAPFRNVQLAQRASYKNDFLCTLYTAAKPTTKVMDDIGLVNQKLTQK